MNYEETLAFLFNKLQSYQHSGSSAINSKLDKTLEFCARLGNPQNAFKCIHVGGTNGKGSVSHYLSSGYQSAGYNVGLYTSPHLKDFTERIKLNGIEVPRDFVVSFVEAHHELIQSIQPSFFELTVVMAFDYFRKTKVDLAIIEVGLGGRWDSTNVINPLISVITNISLDHVGILGDTLEQIAIEKAGIIKQDTPVVIGERQQETDHIFIGQAQKLNAELRFASERDFRLVKSVKTNYDRINQRTAFEVFGILNKSKLFETDEEVVLNGFEQMPQLTGLRGRWDILSQSPLMICDTGHNYGGVKQVVSEIAKLNRDKVHIIWGMVAEKDVLSVLRLLPKKAHYYFCGTSNPRTLSGIQISEMAHTVGLIGDSYEGVDLAIHSAQKMAKVNDLIFIGGSNFVVADIPDTIWL